MHPRSAVVHHPLGFAGVYPERSRMGQSGTFSLLWFPLFAEGEKGEPHASPVPAATNETRRRMPHRVRPDIRKRKTNQKMRKGEVKLVLRNQTVCITCGSRVLFPYYIASFSLTTKIRRHLYIAWCYRRPKRSCILVKHVLIRRMSRTISFASDQLAVHQQAGVALAPAPPASTHLHTSPG